MYKLTLFSGGDAENARASVTVPEAAELPEAARALAAEFGVPTHRLDDPAMLRSPKALMLVDHGSRVVVGLTAPANPTVPDNLIADGIAVETTSRWLTGDGTETIDVRTLRQLIDSYRSNGARTRRDDQGNWIVTLGGGHLRHYTRVAFKER